MSKKSRKLISSQAVQPVPQPEPDEDAIDDELEPQPPTDEFFFLPDAEPDPVDERDLHALMKLWRHGRATRTIWQALSDGYIVVFAVVMLGVMIGNVIVNAQAGMAGCTTNACQMGRLFLPSSTIAAAYALTLMVSQLFGPVLASSAEGFWLMDAPISRKRLLRRRMALPVVLSGVIAAAVVALVAALSGMTALEIVFWALASGIGSAALMAFAAFEQAYERTRVLKLLQGLFMLVAVVIMMGVVAIAAGWLPSATLPMTLASSIVAGLGALAVAGLIVALVAALRHLELIRRARLLSAGSLVAGMQGAMFALDFGLIRDILVERRMMEKGHVRPTRGRGVGLTALVWRDIERIVRNPKPLIGIFLALFVCYAADALRLSQLNPFISGLALVIALVPFLGSLRVLTRTSGLARMMPFKTSELRTAAMALPLLFAVIWGFAAWPAFIGIDATGADRSLASGLMTAMVTAFAGWLGAVRWTTAKKVDFGVPMLATASGAMPPTLIFNLFRGIDMVALITAPLILRGPWWLSIVLIVVVFVALRGTFDMDQMRAEQEQAQREMKAAKEGRTQPKTKIPRPAR